jgi:hypothetical protein
MRSLVESLIRNKNKNPNKIIFADENKSITNQELYDKSMQIASYLSNYYNQPIIIEMPKSVETVVLMMGVLLSGNFYTVLDVDMPEERKTTIINLLEPVCKITTKNNKKSDYVFFEDIIETKTKKININYNMSNPMYVLFTSGSTGIPKGVVVNHNSVMHYLNWFTNEFNINETTVFGNQTPLYFSMSISDVLGTIYAGSTLYFIPHSYFSFPLYLMKYMEENKINTIYWVPSALNMISTFDAFKSFELPELKKVLFAGEVMPPKVINYFVRNHKAYYANLFGPTETTDICTYYEIKEETDNVPIGKACNGLTAIILKDGKESQTGELYIKGPFLASGYYNNPQKTSEVFIQNPLNKAFPEIIYKTGDIVNVREDGNLLYVGRADFQIKHMGYRIELGEIENKVYEIDEVNTCVVVYKNDKIILYYVGNIEEETLLERLKAKVPNYMIPNKIHKESKMNYNLNGKIDRTFYKNLKEDE